MTPLFTIITPTFNAASTLTPTLKSIREQTFHDFEVIVMDGNSKDDTVEMARNAGIDNMTVVSERDRGLYDAMNKAMDRANGEYLIFLNAGDSFHSPETLRTIADVIIGKASGAAVSRRPDIVYGQTQLVDSHRKRIADRHLTAPADLEFKSFAQGMLVCHQAFIVRRAIAGLYDLHYRLSADYEWCIRCLQHSDFNVLIDDILIDYLYEGLSTKNRRQSLKERFNIMCRYYGVLPTVWRHLSFIPRFFRHRNRVRKGLKETYDSQSS